MKKQSYQRGSVTCVRRKNRPDIWKLRYYEYDLFGERVQRAHTIATTEECPTKAAAERRAEPFRQKLNQGPAVYFRQLAERYKTEGVPKRRGTSQVYRAHVNRMQLRWNDVRLDWMCTHPADVERWIRELQTAGDKPRPLANATRGHIRSILHRMFELGMKWGYIQLQRNPIDLVELRGLPREYRRVRPHLVLTRQQVIGIIEDQELPLIVRVAAKLAVCTGLGASEMAGLRPDEDIDFDVGQIRIQRSVACGEVGDPKTTAREKPVEMDQSVAEMLRDFMQVHPPINGWLFGSAETKRPFSMAGLRQMYLAPAAARHGLPYLGWHDFRHTYRALQRELGTPLEVQRDLMRHTTVAMTERYGREADHGQHPEEVRNQLRKANARVVEIFSLAKARA